jgi:metal-dependent amidase/aminoacylase/carboxypeptidase family protein
MRGAVGGLPSAFVAKRFQSRTVALVGDCDALAVAGTASAQTPRTVKSTRHDAVRPRAAC